MTSNAIIGKQRIYNKAFQERGRNDVIKWDVQPLADGQRILVKFISKNSSIKQGVRLATNKGIEIETLGKAFDSVRLFEHTAPKELICKCHTDDGLLSIYNIWDEEDNGFGDSQSYSSGMLLEEKGNLLIYHCNDMGFETKFDKLVFSIEKL